jgi:trk system potassium uptake protein TrkA
VIRRLLPESMESDWIDASGSVALVERELPAPWAGKLLGELNEPGRFTLSAVTRLGNGMVVDGTLVGQEGDILHIVTRLDSLDALQERLDSAADTGGHH